MKIADLTQILQTCPQDLRVVVDGYEGEYDDLDEDLMCVREIRLGIGENWWKGRHNDADFTRDTDGSSINALVLHRPLRATVMRVKSLV